MRNFENILIILFLCLIDFNYANLAKFWNLNYQGTLPKPLTQDKFKEIFLRFQENNIHFEQEFNTLRQQMMEKTSNKSCKYYLYHVKHILDLNIQHWAQALLNFNSLLNMWFFGQHDNCQFRGLIAWHFHITIRNNSKFLVWIYFRCTLVAI